MEKNYTIEIAGVKRDLPLCPLNENLYIAAFIMFGDVELTKKCAEALLKVAPAYDVLITAESKGIPLLYEMARQSGNNYYIVARKGPKLYMKNVISTQVDSITTDHVQTLCIGSAEAEAMRGKRVLIVDDVISTGESLAALETLINQVGGNIVGRMTVLAEGDAIARKDITYLAPLPLFDGEGNPIK
ncbi:MAG: adenine phosphoribosyltransferase [Clostridia bacterium]|nr:adenine phosphoribosyltransferase [Clostridia bacterium]